MSRIMAAKGVGGLDDSSAMGGMRASHSRRKDSKYPRGNR
jgi:hypothetical protein